MSGFQGTFGSPQDDAVVAWIYGAITHFSKQDRGVICKLIQSFMMDRHHVQAIADKKFRNRVALMVLDQHKKHTQKTFAVGVPIPDSLRTALQQRVNNLAVRNYRMVLRGEGLRAGASAIGAASSATGEHVSEGGDTAESATAVIRRDAQPTEGKHPSSVKGIGVEEVIEVREAILRLRGTGVNIASVEEILIELSKAPDQPH